MTPTTAADKVKEIYFSIAKELTGDDWDFTADYERWLTTAEGSRLVGELGEGEWIFCSKQLPDYDELVLWYFIDGNMYVEMLDKDGNDWLKEATHWQPLPEPPKIN